MPRLPWQTIPSTSTSMVKVGNGIDRAIRCKLRVQLTILCVRPQKWMGDARIPKRVKDRFPSLCVLLKDRGDSGNSRIPKGQGSVSLAVAQIMYQSCTLANGTKD